MEKATVGFHIQYNRENKATLNIRRTRVLGEENCQKDTILLV